MLYTQTTADSYYTTPITTKSCKQWRSEERKWRCATNKQQRLASSNQTWLAGKSSVNGGFNGKIMKSHVFQLKSP